MNKTVRRGLILLAIAAAAAGFGPRPEAGAQEDALRGHSAQEEAARGQIELEQTKFPVRAWRSDGSHLVSVKGRLTLGGQPVAGAILEAGRGRSGIRTGEDGSFTLLVDRSLIAYTPVRVASVREATIAGRPLGRAEAERLRSAASAFSVFHPIEVTGTEPSETEAGMVKVHARIVSEAGDRISFFRVDKYRIAGRVTDAGGRPVRDAVVWIDRDGGEGFAKSTPTDRDGRYEMYYWPEEEAANLTVVVGPRRYTLADGKTLVLPRHTSVDLRIRLPGEGTAIADKPPALVCTTAKGAMYSGLLAGLDVPPEVPYTVTLPDRDGRFVLTVPKDVWERRPAFFETRLTKFVGREKVLKAGDALPVGFVQPGDRDPRVTASVAGGSGGSAEAAGRPKRH